MKIADAKAPSRKYLNEASCDRSRRRRASAVSTYRGSESTSSATNIVSRSPVAGKIIMPPTANSTSGKTSVCSRPRAAGEVLVGRAGDGRGRGRERVLPGRGAVGDHERGQQREHHDDALQRQRRTGRSRATRPAPGCRWLLDVGPEQDDRDEGADERGQGQDDLDRAAVPVRHEGLDQHAEDTGPQDDDHGRRGRPSRSWGPRRRLRCSRVAPFNAEEFGVRGGVLEPDGRHGRLRGLAHQVERGCRVRSRAPAGPRSGARRPTSRALPGPRSPSGRRASGPVKTLW